ncbi:VWA domain-containing protein [Streptomyces albus subsp. chlorinus]|nr:VWA domain-containing protein [Streptomyces albus subsp. chlorinus]
MVGALLLTVLAAPLTFAASGTATASGTAAAPPVTARDVASGNGSLQLVLDSSGSMAEKDSSGGTRMRAARAAVSTLVDSLPAGYPTGLRVYGADKAGSCTDTRLARSVRPLDREGIKKAVAGTEPRGETPIGLSLRKAAADLPRTSSGSLGRRTIVLISDGEDTCRRPDPCEVAEDLAEDGVDLRIDAIGFHVRGKAREQLACVAEKGNGRYYDARDADDLARELERAGRLSADGYRFRGTRVTGTASSADAPVLRTPGQYLDTLGPGETRWYSTRLEGASAASAVDFAATGVPGTGTAVGRLDGLKATLRASDGTMCGDNRSSFQQEEGAAPLTVAVSRVPGYGSDTCAKPGLFTVELTRDTADGSDRSRWPVELRLSSEKALPSSVTPSAPATGYGAGGKDAALPTGIPRDVEGGTGFNDATRLRAGVWRDTLLPGQTRWYRVPVGWRQQLRYDVEFANEPKRAESGYGTSFVAAQTYAPGRLPVPDGTEFTSRQSYRGDPVKVSQGTVPVAWKNRAEPGGNLRPVRRDGDYYLAVTLGAGASEIAANAAVRVVLRIDVKGRAKKGPGNDAPFADGSAAADGASAGHGREDGGGTAGPRPAALAGAGAAAVLAAAGGIFYARRRRARVRSTDVRRGGTW